MTSKPVNKLMEPSKADLIRALCSMEGELQAKDIMISILKTEQVRRLLHPCYSRRRWTAQPNSKPSTDTMVPNNRALKSRQQLQHQQHQLDSSSSPEHNQQTLKSLKVNIDPSDPYTALLRDTNFAFDSVGDENLMATKLIYNLQYQNLRALIDHQRRVRKFLESQIAEWESKYNACWYELESEKAKSEKYERDKMISQIEELEKDNDSLKQSVESVKTDLSTEKLQAKSMIMCLVTERKELICRLIELEQHNNTLIDMLESEQCRAAEMSEDLEEESKRSLQMESELERLTASFEQSKALLIDKINTLENKCTKLGDDNNKLKQELEAIKSKRIAQLGEGVRSTIVAVNSSDHKVSSLETNPASGHRSIVVGQVSTSPSISSSSSSTATSSILSTTSSSTPLSTSSPTYAAIQPILKNGTNQATFIANPITPAPPAGPPPPLPKSSTVQAPQVATASSTAQPAQTATAFQNMTYNMDTTALPAVSKSSTGNSSQSTSTSSTQPNRTVTPGKFMIASGSPQAPVQKKLSTGPVTGSSTSPVVRGAPPPIPPNKPILPANALKERSKEIQQATVRAKMMTVKPISTANK